MTSDELPQPETRGALVPPDRHPPTAIGTETPEPPRPPRAPRHASRTRVTRTIRIGPDLSAVVHKALDAIDQVAEAIEVALGIRSADNRSSPSEPPAA